MKEKKKKQKKTKSRDVQTKLLSLPMFRAEQKIVTAKLFTASQWYIFSLWSSFILCFISSHTLILPARLSGNIVDKLAVSVVCIINMDPMPTLRTAATGNFKPCRWHLLQWSTSSPSSSIRVQEIGVSVFKCQHVLVIVHQLSLCVVTSAAELRLLKKAFLFLFCQMNVSRQATLQQQSFVSCFTVTLVHGIPKCFVSL